MFTRRLAAGADRGDAASTAPVQFFVMLVAGWVQRQQAATIDRLKAENRSSANASADGASFLVARDAACLLGMRGRGLRYITSGFHARRDPSVWHDRA